MKLVYMGTPDFAVPALKKLAQVHEVAAVFTQPDKPVGRKQILTPPDVKVCAQKLGIPVCQPASMKTGEALAQLKAFAPEVIVVAAYGQILPKAVLDVPRYGCVNIHGSLLPKYRGAAPIQAAVLNGDKITGVGGELILDTLAALEQGTVTPQKQDEALATHTSKIDKTRCPVDFTQPSQQIHNQIRGLYSWPVATAVIGGKRVKLHGSRLAQGSGAAGTVLSVKPLVIACGEGAIEITELQPEGKKKMIFDTTYLLFILPCVVISLICQVRVKTAFSKYGQIPNARGMTGAQAAEYVLRHNGVTGVRIEHVAGNLTDHYDPRTNVIRLSDAVYNVSSVAAIGVAAHEAGHAVQTAMNYLPNKLRSAILPAARFGSAFSWILIAAGFLFAYRVPNSFGQYLLYGGIILFAASVLFTVITLPVEFDASRRALKCIRETKLLPDEQYKGCKSVLTAAAMTYVASALTAIMQLLRLLLLANRKR